MGIIWTLIIGLVAGIVAKFLMPGPDPGGIIVTILLGVAGAFLQPGWGQTIGWYQAGEGAGFIGAIVGAVIILVLYRMMRRRSATRAAGAARAGRGDGINHALTLRRLHRARLACSECAGVPPTGDARHGWSSAAAPGRGARGRGGDVVTSMPLGTVQAALVSTEQMVAAGDGAAARARVLAFLERADVREQIVALGVDPDEAAARVAALDDAQVREIAGNSIGCRPAKAIGIIVGAILINLPGSAAHRSARLTNVFPFVNHRK